MISLRIFFIAWYLASVSFSDCSGSSMVMAISSPDLISLGTRERGHFMHELWIRRSACSSVNPSMRAFIFLVSFVIALMMM